MTCIGWGPIGDAGYLTRNQAVKDSLASRLGADPLTAEAALRMLGRALAAPQANVAIGDFQWSALARLLPSAQGPRFASLRRHGDDAVGGAENLDDFRALIEGKSPAEVQALVAQLVTQEVAQILAISPERIDPARSLHELGLDSLMGVELALGLEKRFGVQIPAMMLNEGPTIERVTARIMERLAAAAGGGESDAGDLTATAIGMAAQHGESVSREILEAAVADIEKGQGADEQTELRAGRHRQGPAGQALPRAARQPAGGGGGHVAVTASNLVIPEKFCRFDKFPGYERIALPEAAARKLGIENPYFKVHEGVAGATALIDGKTYLNFSSYNYLGLAGDPRVNQAAKDAIDRYGTSASASRLVAGERPIQRELEQAIASLYEVDDCVVFVSGHATNVTTISTLFGPKDLIVHDSLIHNSAFEGIKLSGATRRAFSHNDPESLERILAEIRGNFERTLIVIEGLYSMDGDMPDLPRFIDIKNRYKAFLMVDDAHSLGVLGVTGRGIREHFGVAGSAVDIWMGTLSKSLAGCGGYIAGEKALVQHLKYAASGFVYSVGIAPPMAAASLEAMRIMLAEPERVAGSARTRKLLPRAGEAARNRYRLVQWPRRYPGHCRQLAEGDEALAGAVRDGHQRPANHLSCR